MNIDTLFALALATPIAALLACLWRPARERMLSLLVLAPLPALAVALAALLNPDAMPTLILDPDRRIGLMLDRPGAILLGVAALLWSAAGAYAATYLRGKPHGGRFVVFWLLTLTGSLGVFVAADLLSFYLTFALVSLAAWGLVAHDGTARARRAGVIYLLLAIVGEVLLLPAFVLLADAGPGASLAIETSVSALPDSPWLAATVALLIAGFGLKAGLAPLHVWLPVAHPAAPMPASAVLSGVIVKAGIIGLIRFLPWDAGLDGWGAALTSIGLFTALYAVAMGVLQSNPKTVLAYSTASQMGLVAAILGMGLAIGDREAVTAGTVYAAHHLLAKGALFLAVGVIAATDRRRLWPVLVPAAILALGFAGLPPTGGYLAKLAAKPVLGSEVVGLLAGLAAVGSTLLMIHFLRRVAAGASPASGAQAAAGLVWPWRLLFLAALLLPWMLAPVAGIRPWAALTDWYAIWSGLWPVLAGGVLALALQRWGERLPRVPEGDLLGLFKDAPQWANAVGERLERTETRLRQWPVAGVLLLVLTLLLWTVVLTMS
ncbi:NADH dehydrogenase [Allochromatium humboldtianum]|uniref:NADH dehydrogenase n=1 Tax=Allochromatium humboldtianum TaxID=504901 RepID=A0A850RIZ6_9GAMM|nr:complex I subunit 5 family protein [Allochromatium humboldtianum]NVZ08993.1 NADH dehydrogenase [Allochromatium humboldtianum]